MVIWKENISLWISKIPKQVYSYTLSVNLSMIARKRVSRTGSFFASLNELLKTIKYDAKLYSYIWLILDNPHIAKNKMAPLWAAGVYDWRASYIYWAVIYPLAMSSEISMETFFVDSKVFIRASLSSKLPEELLKLSSSLSSQSFNFFLFSLIW